MHAWTNVLHSTMRTEAQTLRQQAKTGRIDESEYRQRKASLASSLDLNLHRLTREHFTNKLARIEEFEREAMTAYERL